MEVMFSSEFNSLPTGYTAQSPEGRVVHNHFCENNISYSRR
jgi:hypothetical protein